MPRMAGIVSTEDDTESCQAQYAGVIKKVHAELRAKCQNGSTAEEVWREHVSPSNEAQLSEYASCMRRLATDVWDVRHGGAPELSRVAWLHAALLEYHTEPQLTRARAYDDRLAERHGLTPRPWTSASELSSLPAFDTLDVGSCYGPFCGLPRLRVTALDLCPASPDVLRGDFLSVPLEAQTRTADGRVLSLATGSWHAVVFCLLLEYLPTPALRYECCRRAAELLKEEGVLLVASPDSAHRTANGPLYRAWRLAIATLGLVRVRYEKTEHLHCMVFRKSAHSRHVAQEARAQIAQDAARGRLVWQDSRSAAQRLSPGSDGERLCPGVDGDGDGVREVPGSAVCTEGTVRPSAETQNAEKRLCTPSADVENIPRRTDQDVSLPPEPPGCDETPPQTACSTPEPYQLMVIHQDLKPTVLKSDMPERTLHSEVDIEEALSELPQL